MVCISTHSHTHTYKVSARATTRLNEETDSYFGFLSASVEKEKRFKRLNDVHSPCTFYVADFGERVDVDQPQIRPLRVGHHHGVEQCFASFQLSKFHFELCKPTDQVNIYIRDQNQINLYAIEKEDTTSIEKHGPRMKNQGTSISPVTENATSHTKK